VKKWLRGCLAKWRNGRTGNDNVKVWVEKWTVKNLALLYRRLSFINLHIFEVSSKNEWKT